jgi:predicted RNA binding protein YcfA (HicA-like mRNA interferase family)
VSKREKLRRKLRNNPQEATIQEVETLLFQYSFTRPRISGSHHIFEYDDGVEFRQIVIPLHGRKVKKVYIKRVVEILDELFPQPEDDSDE